jgi:hypothetical protein
MVRSRGAECVRRAYDRCQRAGRDASTGIRLWMIMGLGLLLVYGCGLTHGWMVSRLRAAPSSGAPPIAAPRAQTPFETSMATAMRLYLRAEAASTQQLDVAGEWDPDALNGSAPEHYRRVLMARTRELGLAEEAAREAERRAGNKGESYRALLLLARIECDLGHHRTELEEAKQLAALRPQDPGAFLVLRRAAQCNGQAALARQAELKLDRLLHPRPTPPLTRSSRAR